MISEQKDFLFIHIPKTGGNSIQNILKRYSEDEVVTLAPYHDGEERFELRNQKFSITKHSTLSVYKSVLDPEIYNSLYKFAVLRNPWDRMISFYFSPHRGKREWNRDDFLELVDTTHPVSHYVCETPDREFEQTCAEPEVFTACQDLAKDIDFLMRFERLSDDFKRVCSKLDIPESIIPRRNRSEHQHYSVYYDQELREIVGRKFSDEIAFGKYEFDNGKSSWSERLRRFGNLLKPKSKTPARH